jgi:DNA-binding CsgD family transcriptional regulator
VSGRSNTILESEAQSDVALVDILQCLSEPLMLLGADRRVHFANAAAAEMLESDDGLMLRGETVCGSDREVHDTLVKTIAATVAGAPRGNASMLLRRRIDGRCAVLHLLRLRPSSQASVSRILARVCNNAVLLAPDIQTVQNAFGLSRTEAEIALRIAAGDSPRMIANKRVVSEETVRWHIKNIYSKTCTSRLVDLAQQLCAALSPFFAGVAAGVPPPRAHHMM